MPVRHHLPADERRTATVEAVVELAAKQNPSDITTAAIAQHMGLTQGALFRHFPTKDAVMQAVMAWVTDRLLGRVDEAIANAPTPVAGLEAAFMAHVDFVVRHPGVPRMLFGELQRPAATPTKKVVKALLQQYAKRVATLLAAGKAQGALDAKLDVDAATIAFVGTFQGLVMRTLLVGTPSLMRREAGAVFAIYLRGIGGGTP
ncbi:MAG: TetR/AcrR family transcriptional regulator [Rhodanobacter sp.]|nr:MAG: TetR/AcrR family transcriptional regulator [Rhodanobacter sp.]TAM08449.1 MAG: TetR/AcrR family transcriptional regulator [Rhodanobacter sp.]TAM36577.1 MAG: TetR/AcrR family transcriptional regulator [Rhodanobacter sp.]